ncbi:MAG: ATP synthase F0 subunit B [Deltaproteobacteria bacterium]|nr:ATP synthase F0 subunit B [Deltaproteobacteria bacterium]
MGLPEIKARQRPSWLLLLSFCGIFLTLGVAESNSYASTEGAHPAEATVGSQEPGSQDTTHINWTSWDYGHGKTEANPPFLMAIINFSLVIFALIFFVRKPLGSFLADRHHRIKEDLAAAAALREQARLHLSEIDTKLDGLQGQISKIREDVAKDAEAEKEQIILKAERDAAALVESAERTLEIEIERAKRRLEVGAVKAALESAEKLLQREIGAEDQRRLREDYFEQIQSAGGGH